MDEHDKALLAGTRVNLRLDQIKPYWRNPRSVPEEAVNALADSIRQFGYRQPIVVDDEYVIIIGHTRYAALRKLGVDDAIPVMVTTDMPADKVKQLRVIDNRVAEFTSWDYEALLEELAELDSNLLTALFPEKAANGASEIIEIEQRPERNDWDAVVPTVEFVCPSCYFSWEIEVTREAVFAGRIEVKEEGKA